MTEFNAKSFQGLLKWPAFLVGNLILFVFIGTSTAREVYREYHVDQDIQSLEAETARLDGRKMELMGIAEALAQPDRVDWEARSRLGWKKPGETMVALPSDQGAASALAKSFRATSTSAEDAAFSNPEKWWTYFFGMSR